jgi:hypothetical protein
MTSEHLRQHLEELASRKGSAYCLSLILEKDGTADESWFEAVVEAC